MKGDDLRKEIGEWASDWASTLDGEAAAMRAAAQNGDSARAAELVAFARTLERAARRIGRLGRTGRRKVPSGGQFRSAFGRLVIPVAK